jgi:diaminopimelate epimerase
VQFHDLEFVRVSVGNPHAVTFVDSTSDAPVDAVGAALEISVDGGTNVEFAHVGSEAIEVRTWERGCGETQACGTGAVAVAAAARQAGRAGDRVVIRLLGGELIIEFDDDRAWITGPARYSFAGVWSGSPVRV